VQLALAGQVMQLVRAEGQLLGLEAGQQVGTLTRAAEDAIHAQQARQSVARRASCGASTLSLSLSRAAPKLPSRSSVLPATCTLARLGKRRMPAS
jgi:hypothetical protein